MRPAALAVVLLATAAVAQKPKVAILEFTRTGDVDPGLATAFNEAVATELSAQGVYDPVTSREIASLIGMERQKELLGCSTDGASCIAELGNALGAKLILSGSLAKLGEAYQLNLQSIDSGSAQVQGRSSFLSKDIEEIRAGLPFLVARAVDAPQPEIRSRVPGYLTVGAGLVTLGLGVLSGMQTLNQEQALQKELKLGASAPVVLKSLDYYQAETDRIGRDKSGALTAVIAGTGAVVCGWLFLLPKPPRAAQQATLVPTGHGFAVVGTW